MQGSRLILVVVAIGLVALLTGGIAAFLSPQPASSAGLPSTSSSERITVTNYLITTTRETVAGPSTTATVPQNDSIPEYVSINGSVTAQDFMPKAIYFTYMEYKGCSSCIPSGVANYSATVAQIVNDSYDFEGHTVHSYELAFSVTLPNNHDYSVSVLAARIPGASNGSEYSAGSLPLDAASPMLPFSYDIACNPAPQPNSTSPTLYCA